MRRFIIRFLLIVVTISTLLCQDDIETEGEQNNLSLNTNQQDSIQEEFQNGNDFNDSNQEYQIEDKQGSQNEEDNSNVQTAYQNIGGHEEEVQLDINVDLEDKEAFDQHNMKKQENQKKVDIIAMEIQQLQSLIELHKSKLTLLSNLRENMIKNNITFQEFNTTLLKKKVQTTSQQIPVSNQEGEEEVENLSAKISNIYQTNTKKLKIKPQKLIELQQFTFSNRLDKKFSVRSLQKLNKVKSLQSFQYKANNGVKSNLMLASLTNDSSIIVHDFSGDMATDPYTPGHQIHLFSVSQRQDEVFIATIGDDFNLRIAKIDNQKVKSQFSEDENQFKYKMKPDLYFALDSFAKTLPLADQAQSFEFVQFQSQKIFLIGDKQGFLHVYNKNGTFISKETLSNFNLPILSLQKLSAPSILYFTEKEIGFFNLNTLKKSQFECSVEDLQILKVKPDPFISNMFYALTKNQQLLAYEFKIMDEYCKQKEVFDFESQIQGEEDEQFNINKQQPYFNTFVPIKNFILLMSNQQNKIRILNTTDVQGEGIQDGFDLQHTKLFENLNNQEDSIQFLFQQKIYQGNYLIAGYTQNQGQATAYTLYEIVAPQPKEFDFLSQIRFPLIVTVIVGIISYQVWKNYKSKNMYKKNKNDYAGFKKNLDINSKKGSKNNNENNNSQQVNQYKDKLSQLEESTSQLLKNTQRLEQKQKQVQKRNNFDELDDEDDDVYDNQYNPLRNNNSRQYNDFDYRQQMDDEIDNND